MRYVICCIFTALSFCSALHTQDWRQPFIWISTIAPQRSHLQRNIGTHELFGGLNSLRLSDYCMYRQV